MSLTALFAADLVAIGVLVFALYVPRHHHRQMVVALLVVNVGVLGVTQALASADVGAGLGLGLFGVLSIIRLRSAEMSQSDVAYYFAALALGLLGGFAVEPAWLTGALMAAVLTVVFVGDHPRLLADHGRQVVTLDRAYTDEGQLTARLERLLGAEITHVDVRKVDLVDDTTVVETRYRIRSGGPAGHIEAPLAGTADLAASVR